MGAKITASYCYLKKKNSAIDTTAQNVWHHREKKKGVNNCYILFSL